MKLHSVTVLELAISKLKQVNFTAYVAGANGDIAIDQIEVFNTSCSQQACLDGLFQCELGSCVEKEKVIELVFSEFLLRSKFVLL